MKINDTKNVYTASGSVKLVLGFASLVMMLSRLPTLLLHRRLWAEEVVFYMQADRLVWWHAILQPYGGYLNLTAGIAGLAARHFVRLSDAPLVTMFWGGLWQALPWVILLCVEDQWLQDWRVLLCAVSFVSLAPSAEEIWLQSLNSQFHLTLALGIILGISVPSGKVRLLTNFALIIAPLAGPACWVLAPLFVLRALIERSIARAKQSLLLIFGILAQLVFFYSNYADRGFGVTVSSLLNVVFVKDLVLPLLGSQLGAGVAHNLHHTLLNGHNPVWPAAAVLIWLGGLLALALGCTDSLWLTGASIALAVFAYLGSIDHLGALLFFGVGQRYSFAPNVLIAMSILRTSASQKMKSAWVARALLCWMIPVWAFSFFHPSIKSTQGPDWLYEVNRWREDPSHGIATWPSGWFLQPVR